MPDREIPRGYILGFDFGLRRIGVAVGQAQTRTATPIATVAHKDQPDWHALALLVSEWKPSQFVVGLPLSEDGEATEMSKRARNFGNRLSDRFQTPVAFADERLTSRQAEESFAMARAKGGARRSEAGKLDAVAARIILENWLQSD